MRPSRRAAFTLLALALLALPLGMAQNLIKINFQSKWFPQAQFGDYWAAGGHLPGAAASASAPTEDGLNFYAQEDLDVTILDGGNATPSANTSTAS